MYSAAWDSYGLPQTLRLSIGSEEANRELVSCSDLPGMSKLFERVACRTPD
ncbi:MAG: hypothetical protein IPF48_13670 [Sphingomonadales bacterium]|nr:hypothetical protein [Sphingomonadales bacterium]